MLGLGLGSSAGVLGLLADPVDGLMDTYGGMERHPPPCLSNPIAVHLFFGALDFFGTIKEDSQ